MAQKIGLEQSKWLPYQEFNILICHIKGHPRLISGDEPGVSVGLRLCQSLPLSATIDLGVLYSLWSWGSWDSPTISGPPVCTGGKAHGSLLVSELRAGPFSSTLLTHTGCSSYCHEPYE